MNRLLERLESRALFSASVICVVYTDLNHNHSYDADDISHPEKPSEGVGGVTVTLTSKTDSTHVAKISSFNGSLVFFNTPAGDYTLTATGSNIKKAVTLSSVHVDDNTAPVFHIPVTPGTGTTGGAPDLAVTVSPVQPALNARTRPVTVKVTNNGDSYTGPLTVTAYFSEDQIIDSSDTALPPVSLSTVSIAGHKSKSFPVNLAPFASVLPPGQFFILVKLSGVTGDTNAANDTAASTGRITVVAPTVNLTPTVRPGRVSRTGSLPFTLTIRNTGNTTATGPVSVSLAARPAAGGADIPLLSPTPVLLTIGPNRTVTFPRGSSVVDLTSLPAGSYRLVLTLSIASTPAETATADNTVLSPPFTIL
jgi:hypothetical protein